MSYFIRIPLLLLLLLFGSRSKAQIVPDFWFSPTSDTVMMIEFRGESAHHTFTYIYMLGAPSPHKKNVIQWFRAFMDSTKNKNATGYDLLKADTLRKYNFKLRGELMKDKENDSLDLFYPNFDVVEMKKGADTTIHIFQITYQVQLSVGREKVIETKMHHYEYMGTSIDEAYTKPLITVLGWNIPGKRRQIWTLGCSDFYYDLSNNSVRSFPSNYFGFR